MEKATNGANWKRNLAFPTKVRKLALMRCRVNGVAILQVLGGHSTLVAPIMYSEFLRTLDGQNAKTCAPFVRGTFQGNLDLTLRDGLKPLHRSAVHFAVMSGASARALHDDGGYIFQDHTTFLNQGLHAHLTELVFFWYTLKSQHGS
eukprot:2522354-Amphidinium_carterae.1